MKKVYMLGMVLTLAACFAYAASLSVPWYMDNTAVPGKLPPTQTGVLGLVYLHNNLPTDVVCEIAYYTQEGLLLDFAEGQSNTFEIAAMSSVAFRPAVSDPISNGGQEADPAMAVPNRPTNDGKKNGSIVVSWTTGGLNDVQGIVLQTQNVGGGLTARLLQWGTLLPPGS